MATRTSCRSPRMRPRLKQVAGRERSDSRAPRSSREPDIGITYVNHHILLAVSRQHTDRLRQYIIDGYHVSHDPARESITEPTTGRKLNVLDIPKSPAAARGVAPASAKQVKPTQSGHQRRVSSANVAKGRSLSPSQIKSPQPTKPHETRVIATERFDNRDVERLTTRLRNTPLSDSESDISESESDSGSDLSSDVPSLSSRSSNSSSPSSISSTGSCCSCERYGITRSGNRVKLDCGGRLCGFSDHSSTCSSESESEDKRRVKTTRRQGLVVRR